ncbi:hypothetical protein K402DRAFT_394039 [Aulographum hederae CBS 113979]|uniref:Uncharacterized protein n=1 Tax=Aulographum hederae CBS 113979 TaxID=1176131 RepID=A0A6G1GYZ3_9PEZI|nr:hypothetical protein K402DRAFT_394039 [Aulographum hederae CBS 113979]
MGWVEFRLSSLFFLGFAFGLGRGRTRLDDFHDGMDGWMLDTLSLQTLPVSYDVLRYKRQELGNIFFGEVESYTKEFFPINHMF